ncbi:Na+/H+ antiporter subunit G [Bermanella sp. R86510]|uniref:Na+/H+ antiporter subunit G n=1 Tax=unclassified Bermanella TaxID=2627862 RepID=UPI0037C62833
MEFTIELIASILLVVGGLFVLIGALGMVKLPDFYTRLHAPTKATTLGIGCMLIASLLLHALRGDGIGIQELVISLFLFLTAPVSAYMIAKAAIHKDVPLLKRSTNQHLTDTIKTHGNEEQESL